MLKKYWNLIFIFILIFIITLLYSCCYSAVHGDIIYCFGFARNLSQGMVIYKDFNVMQTPLYFFVACIFIKIFGNYLVVMYILNSICVSLIMILMFKIIGKKCFIIYPFILFFTVATYNYFCLLLLFIIIYLIYDKKNHDVLIGILVGLIFLTKQSVGLLLIPYLYYSRNKVKGFICFCLPLLFFFVYLIYYGAVYQFIDYCFLGLLDFNSSNSYFSIITFLEIFVLLYLIINLFISKFKDKELFYILMFQIIVYPIFDMNHFAVVLIPVLYYFLKKSKFYYLSFIMFFINYTTIIVLCFVLKPYVSLSSDYFYFTNDLHHKYVGRLEEEKVIILKYKKNYDYQFYIMGNVYYRKIYLNEKVGQYDFILNGNMGYHGDKRIINKIDNICKLESCVFFVEDVDFNNSQLSKLIYDYVIDNYSLIDDSNRFLRVYSNER